MSKEHHILERDIFGGSDSELSSDDEYDIRQQQQQQQQQQVPRDSPVLDEDSSEGGDSGDEYVHDNTTPSKQRKRFVRRTDVGEEADENEPPRRVTRPTAPVKRRRRKPSVSEINLDDLPPEQANKLRIDMQIEAILKPKKTARLRKRKKDHPDEDALDRFADEEVSRLRDAMLGAADEDDTANKARMPATAKLRLLPQVMEVLRKASLAQSIVDNNLLEGVRRFLEPLPDRSLPALNIQRELFTVLRRLEFVDAAALKESGLGRVVLFYTKCKRVNAEVARAADQLVSVWSRPIIKRSASYRDRVIPMAREHHHGHAEGGGASGQGAGASQPQHETLKAIIERGKESDKHRVRKNAVLVPQRELGMYTVAPKDGLVRGDTSVDVDIERRRKNAERLRGLTRRMTARQ